LKQIEELQVRDLAERLSKATGIHAVVFDGVVTQKLADVAAEQGIKYLVGMRARVDRMPAKVRVLTLDELRRLRAKTRSS
jgi:phosphohistidine swiveling domain-containing protein